MSRADAIRCLVSLFVCPRARPLPGVRPRLAGNSFCSPSIVSALFLGLSESFTGQASSPRFTGRLRYRVCLHDWHCDRIENRCNT